MRFLENPFVGWRVIPCGRAGGRAGGRTNKNTDMTKLRVAVRNFAIAPEITMRLIAGFNEPLRLCVYAIGQTTPYPYPQTSDCITNDLLYCSVNAMFETSELKNTLFFFFLNRRT